MSVVPVVGYFRAWVAEKMGDDTPERLGFLTLNPLDHISFFWVIAMMLDLVSIGFGRYIPLNPHNFYGRYRTFKMLVAYLSDAFANIIFALLSLFAFVAIFGEVNLINSFSHVGRAALYSEYAQTTSFMIVFALFLSSIVFFNSMLATFNIIVNLFYAGFFYFYSSRKVVYQNNDHMQWVLFVGPIIFLILFFESIQNGVIRFIVSMGTYFSKLLFLFS